MASLTKRLEKMFMAAAFAEAGEFDTARDILKEEDRPENIDRIQSNNRVRKELRAPGMPR